MMEERGGLAGIASVSGATLAALSAYSVAGRRDCTRLHLWNVPSWRGILGGALTNARGHNESSPPGNRCRLPALRHGSLRLGAVEGASAGGRHPRRFLLGLWLLVVTAGTASQLCEARSGSGSAL